MERAATDSSYAKPASAASLAVKACQVNEQA
jgi:hypothetical protein